MSEQLNDGSQWTQGLIRLGRDRGCELNLSQLYEKSTMSYYVRLKMDSGNDKLYLNVNFGSTFV